MTKHNMYTIIIKHTKANTIYSNGAICGLFLRKCGFSGVLRSVPRNREDVNMITQIRKRDGREAPFNIEKIANAVFKAAQATGGKDYNMAFAVAQKVCAYLEEQYGDTPSVENIQDAVEKILVEEGHARTAKEFILYRAERSRVREMDSRLMKIFEELTFKDARDSDIKRENANIDGDTAMGTMLKYGSEGAKRFYEMFVDRKSTRLNSSH